jgi:hypothetical protein
MRMCNLGQQLFEDYDRTCTPAAYRAWERHKRGCGECGGRGGAGVMEYQDDGHAPDCELAQALRGEG